jgi:hypothetical protein
MKSARILIPIWRRLGYRRRSPAECDDFQPQARMQRVSRRGAESQRRDMQPGLIMSVRTVWICTSARLTSLRLSASARVFFAHALATASRHRTACSRCALVLGPIPLRWGILSVRTVSICTSAFLTSLRLSASARVFFAHALATASRRRTACSRCALVLGDHNADKPLTCPARPKTCNRIADGR